MDNKVVNFLKGSAILVCANIALKAINFFLLPLYTKYLSPEQLGISDTVSTLISLIFPLLVLGLDSGISAFYYDERSDAHKKKVVSTAWVTLLLVSSIPILLSFFADSIAKFFLGSESYQLLIAIGLVSVSMNLWYLPFALFVRMENKMGVFALINITASLTMIGLNVFFVAGLGWGEYALITSTAIVQLFQVVLYLIFGKLKPSVKCFNRHLIKKMLKYSLPLIPTAVITWILNLSDRYLILWFCGEGEVGVYGIAARFAGALAVLASGVYTAYTTFAFDKKDDKNASRQYSRILNDLFFILMGVCFTVSLFGKQIISIMTTSDYYEAYMMLPALLFAQVLYGINTITGYGIAFAKKPKYILIANTVGAIINIVFNILFIPIYGAVAAGYTTLLGYLVMVVLTYYFAQRLYPCDYKIARIGITTGVLFLPVLLAVNFGMGIKLGVWIVGIFILACLYKDSIKDIRLLINYLLRK